MKKRLQQFWINGVCDKSNTTFWCHLMVKIESDWPCLIFSDKRWFPLKPLFFANEVRAQIIRLTVETCERLISTINVEELAISVKLLWEKTTSIMTDTVSENLQVGDRIAEVFQLSHILYHLPCKSHFVTAFDCSNIHVLTNISKQVDFRNKLEMLNPAIKSILHGSASVVECAISSYSSARAAS